MAGDKSAPVRIISEPGVKRDGTQLEGPGYIDALWCRFRRGLPRKMGGHRAITSTIGERVYGMHIYAQDAVNYLHLGGASSLLVVTVDSNGAYVSQDDRIPVGFANSADNLWQFDTLRDDTGAGTDQIIAHAAPNLATIDSSVETPIYVGEITDTGTVLVATGMDDQSGGIVSLHPYLLGFGNAGRVQVSGELDLTTPLGVANVCGSKIVAGRKVRSSGGPAGLLWALDELIRVTFDPSLSPIPFSFDPVVGETSLMSSRCIVEHNGIFYWWTLEGPHLFNGVIQDLPNNFNLDWFLDNLNFAHRQKMFGMKVPRFKEIWWFFPFGSATECTHAIIYNYEGGFWYDTALSTADQAGRGRTDGVYAKTYRRPIMIDQVLTTEPGYTMWEHEVGTDSINGSNIQPIRSYFQTGEISMLTGNQPQDASLRVGRIEPDFVQAGDLTVRVAGRDNAQAAEVDSEPVVIPDTVTEPRDQGVPLKEVRRLMSFKFESNTVGGHYEMGNTLAHIGPSGQRNQS